MVAFQRIFIMLLKLITSILLFVIFLLGLIYIQTPIYNFPPPAPFSGDSLINPYQNIGNQTLKCNFHAHTHAWSGLTNGHNTPQELTEAYTQHGYDVSGVSNYHCIEDKVNSLSKIYIPVYEHGINIFKSHTLGINANKPSYFDYPLWQNTSQKQQIINDIANNGGLVAIAHPKFMDGHTLEDMAQLTNYRFVEVLNHYRISDEYWDAALTAGRLVYGIGNDDTHDINNEPTFKIWTEVFADTASAEGVLKALQQGKSYMVHAEDGEADLKVLDFKVKNDSVYLYIQGPLLDIDIYSKGHVLVDSLRQPKSLWNNVKKHLLPYCLSEMIFPYKKEYPYMRIVGKSDKCTIYLNPIVRSVNGKTSGVEKLVPELNQFKTGLYRLIVGVVELLVVALFLYLWKFKPFKR